MPFISNLGAVEYVATKDIPVLNKKLVRVNNVKDLEQQLNNIADNTTVLIAPGIYKLSELVFIRGRKNIEIRGAQFDRNEVKIVGKGYKNKDFGECRHCLEFSGCTNVRVANLSIGDVYHHPVAMQGDCTDMHFYNVRFFDAGEQFLKGNSNYAAGRGVLRGKVEYCLFEYTEMARSWYTQAIDIHTGKDWVITNNIIYNIMGPAHDQMAGHAILMWNGAENTHCENNLIINCARGIAYGLNEKKPPAKGKQYDHNGGKIVNNIFVRDPGVRGDDGILITNSPNSKIIGNKVFCSGYETPIEYRYKNSSNIIIKDNILDGRIWQRDGATGTEDNNMIVSGKKSPFALLRKDAFKHLQDAQNFIPKSDSFIHLKALAKKVYNDESYGRHLKKLRPLLESENAEEKKEAQDLFAYVEKHFNRLMTKAREQAIDDPIGALAVYDAVAKQFSKDAFGDEAKTEIKAIKDRPNYKSEKQAYAMYQRLVEMEKGRQVGNAAQLNTLNRGLDLFMKRYGDSIYLKLAKELKSKVGNG